MIALFCSIYLVLWYSFLLYNFIWHTWTIWYDCLSFSEDFVVQGKLESDEKLCDFLQIDFSIWFFLVTLLVLILVFICFLLVILWELGSLFNLMWLGFFLLIGVSFLTVAYTINFTLCSLTSFFSLFTSCLIYYFCLELVLNITMLVNSRFKVIQNSNSESGMPGH